MDFSFSEEHQLLRETVRRFSETELAPLVREADDSEIFPRELFPKWGEMGLIAARYPEKDGGGGFDKIADCIIREETSRVCQAFASSLSAHSHLGIWPIWRIGTDAQKEKYLKPAMAGEKVSCFGLSEPDGGSNIRALKTQAKKVDGGYLINGSKLYITNAPMADFMLLAARTSPELSADSISMFIVDLPSENVVIQKLAKESIRASETGLIFIEDLFIPDENLLGEEEGTYPVILESLMENRVGVSANCLGMAKAAFEEANRYAHERIISGRPIGKFQAIGHKLANMSAEIEAAQWMVYNGAWQVDQGTLNTAMAAKIKLVASEMAVKVSEDAIRILGGAGIMRDYSVGRIHRDTLLYIIGEGTSEIQRNIIARSLGF
ncbi:MAG: acyl-CoA dehydrogenase family protein [Cycloclasticus sp.]|jgi:butyryl-CoA dehydrogenase|nr:acyl-CoA dehydrogenase family protein [Cycloclasticus sp.]